MVIKQVIQLRNLWMVVALLLPNIQRVSAQNTGLGTVDAETFKNPPNEYRITQYQLTRQTLKKYPEYGIGGTMAFFYSILYPKSGKKNHALGKNGPGIIGELVDAAKGIDYNVWLADDWGYPSGMAGGRVVAENPDWEVKGLTMLSLSGKGNTPIEFTLPEDLYDMVYAVRYPEKNGAIDLTAAKRVAVDGKRISTRGLEGDWQLKIFARYVRDKNVQAQSTMKQFGHTGRYPDPMNREAISRFIANMHEPILAQIKDPANSVEGFYTNEPNLMQTHWKRKPDASYACVPWSDGLPAQFRKMHGYELFAVLPFLFDGQSDEARRARIHYRQAVAELFTHSFAKQIREWCNARGIKSSGHFLLNEYLSMHAQGYGDLMKFVSEFDVPALDIPIPNPDEFMKFPYQQTRFFSSVASWKERDKTIMLLDPIIGGYGRSRLSPKLPLLLNAVNMASFHGANLFTSYLPLEAKEARVVNGHRQAATAGYTKREFRFFNEYTGRLTQVLRGAKREANVGLYYPIAMFQADLLASNKFWPDIRDRHKDRQHKWDLTETALLNGDVEYMIVHPEAVAEAVIENGRMHIGHGAYHTLVMPQLEFIPHKVAVKLQRFEEAGGKVLWVDHVPRAAEHAKYDKKVEKILEGSRPVNIDQVADLINNSYSPSFDLVFSPGTDQLTVGRFHKNKAQVYLIVNRTQKAITIDIKGQRTKGTRDPIKVLDPSTGKIKPHALPAKLRMKANRALLLIPSDAYLEQPLEKK